MEFNISVSELRNYGQYPGVEAGIPLVKKQERVKTVRRNYHRQYSLLTYALFFFIFSFIGWLWEVGIHIVEDGVFVNRGTLFGPWLPIYGVGGVLGIILLRKIMDNQVLTFFCVVLMCSLVEYLTSFFIEATKHIKYWDYSGYFCNINGRICLEGVLLFGFAGCAGIYILAPLFDDLLERIPKKVRLAACILLIILFITDLIYSKYHPNAGKGITDYAIALVQVGCMVCLMI